MHLGNGLGELSLLDLVFKGHLDKVLVMVLVVLLHELEIELGPHELDFGLVQSY